MPIGWRGRIAALLMLAAAMVASWLLVSAVTRPEWPVPASLTPAAPIAVRPSAAAAPATGESVAPPSRSGALRAEASAQAPASTNGVTAVGEGAGSEAGGGEGGAEGTRFPADGDRLDVGARPSPVPARPLDPADGIDQSDGSGPSSASSTSWLEVLERIEDNRSVAFATSDPSLLTEVYAAASPSLRSDAAALAELDAAQLHAIGLRLQIEDVTVERAAADAVTLRVLDRLPGYRLVDRSGATVAVEPGRGTTSWLITVVPGQHGWLINAIESP